MSSNFNNFYNGQMWPQKKKLLQTHEAIQNFEMMILIVESKFSIKF